MGFDAGGGGGRCLVLDLGSGRSCAVRRNWSHATRQGAELQAEGVWSDLAGLSRRALQRSGARPDQVVGLAATSMRHSLVALDEAGRAILAAANTDARAVLEGLRLGAEHGRELHSQTGRWPGPIFAAPRLRWLRREEPELWAQIRSVLSLSDWVAYRLCGERASEPTQACETLLFSIQKMSWDRDLEELCDVPLDLFPELRKPGEALGRLSRAAADALGLRAGTPVAVGAADTACGLLGLGVLDPDGAAAVAGTTCPVQQVVSRPELDRQVWTGPHFMEATWVVESNAGGMGDSVSSLAALLYPEAPSPAGRLLAEAGDEAPGAGGFHASIGAGAMRADALQLPLANLSFTPLQGPSASPRTSRVARAVAEGAAFALRENLEQLERVCGRPAGSLALGGGLARSAVWQSIVAAVLDRPIRVGEIAESSALGAALCAASGSGHFEDPPAAARELVRTRGVEPDPEAARGYERLYPEWIQLREAREPADEIARGQQLRALQAGVAAAPAPARERVAGRILVTADLDSTGLSALQRLGEVESASYRERRRLLRGEELIAELGGASVFVTEIDLLDIEVLLGCPDLRVVVSCRGDPVNVDVDACTACGVAVLNTPGRNAEAVADLTLAFCLMLLRKLAAATSFLEENPGEPGDLARLGRGYALLRGGELGLRTVGLVGFGAVGRAVARRLRGFGTRVLVFDPLLDERKETLAGIERVELDELLGRSDIVSLHAAVTPESRGLIGSARLAQTKPGALLINTARAALVDEEALAEALDSGQLAGAAIDTFSVEPPGADHPLLGRGNVLTTPHIGGNTLDIPSHQGRIAAQGLEALLRGGRPGSLCNPEVLSVFDWERPRPRPSEERLADLRSAPGPAVSDLQRG